MDKPMTETEIDPQALDTVESEAPVAAVVFVSHLVGIVTLTVLLVLLQG